MSKCEKRCIDCIHFDMCAELHAYYKGVGKERVTTFMCDGHSDKLECGHFKDKSLCVELPCKLGDTVYMPWKWNGQEGIAQLRVITMVDVIGLGLDFGTNFETDDDAYYEEYDGGRFKIEDVGKKVFLTKEEAERKLSEV